MVRPPIHAESEACRPCERLALILIDQDVASRVRRGSAAADPHKARSLPAALDPAMASSQIDSNVASQAAVEYP